jgi:hypothetical protein
MTLSGIDLGDCKVTCRRVQGRDKVIFVFVSQVCEWRPAFLVTGPPKCEGRCDERSKCTFKLSYFWEIVAQNPANSAMIVGPANGRTVFVRGTVLLGQYTLELTVTLQCKCGDKDVGAPLVQKKQRVFQVNTTC